MYVILVHIEKSTVHWPESELVYQQAYAAGCSTFETFSIYNRRELPHLSETNIYYK